MAPDKVKETMGPLQEYARTLDEIDRIKSAPAGSRDIFQDADRKIAALNNLAADSGFDPETTERAGDAIRGIHVELDRMAEAARSTLEQEMQTPAEKLSARLEYLKKLFNTVGMSAETMARATKAAGQSFLQGMGVEAETPFEAYARKMKDLVAARKDLGEDVFGRGVTGLFDNLAKSSGLLETKLPTAAEQGSREAFSAIHQFEAGAQGSSPSEILQQILTQQNARAAKGNAKLQEIIQALKDFNVVDFG